MKNVDDSFALKKLRGSDTVDKILLNELKIGAAG
jgi:hypothetical protein